MIKTSLICSNSSKYTIYAIFQAYLTLSFTNKHAKKIPEIYQSKNIYWTMYSSRKWMLVVCCLMKKNCYFQRGVTECRHAATPLSFYSINTTHQGFQKRYITLFYLKGLKSYQPSKSKCLHFTPLSLVNRTFHLHFCWYLLSPLMYNKDKYLFWKPWSVVIML